MTAATSAEQAIGVHVFGRVLVGVFYSDMTLAR